MRTLGHTLTFDSTPIPCLDIMGAVLEGSAMQKFASMTAFADFGRLWLLTFLAALAAAVGANMVFHIPLNTVVDVLLAVQVFLLALAECWFGARLLLSLATGRLEDASAHLAAMAAYVFLLSPTLLAFYAFAYMRGETLAGASLVYDDIMAAFGAVFMLPAQIVSAGIVLATKGGGYVSYVNQIKGVLEAIYYVVGILVALPALGAATRRRQDAQG